MLGRSPSAGASRQMQVGLPVRGTGPGLLRLMTVALAMVAIGAAAFTLYAIQQRQGDQTPRTAAERALLDAKRAIEKDPRDVAARMQLARVYIGMGRTEEAKGVLLAAAQLENKNIQVAHLLGLAYLEAGEYEPAVRQLRAAAGMKDGFAEQYAAIHADIGRCYSLQEQWKQAAASYREAVGYAPEAADLVFELGTAYERLGKKKDAVKAYEGVLKFVPDHEGAQRALTALRSTTQ